MQLNAVLTPRLPPVREMFLDSDWTVFVQYIILLDKADDG